MRAFNGAASPQKVTPTFGGCCGGKNKWLCALTPSRPEAAQHAPTDVHQALREVVHSLERLRRPHLVLELASPTPRETFQKKKGSLVRGVLSQDMLLCESDDTVESVSNAYDAH